MFNGITQNYMQTQITVTEQYIVSSGITFLTAFVIALGAQLSSSTFTPSQLGWSAVGAIGWVAARAGIKAVIEYLAGITGTHTVN